MILKKSFTCSYRVHLGYMSDQKIFSPVATIHIDDLSDLLSGSEDEDLIMKKLRENKSVELEVKVNSINSFLLNKQ